MSMTPEAVVRAWFTEIWNEGQEDAVDRLADAAFKAHGAPPLANVTEFRTMYRQFHQLLTDINVTVERTISEGDSCAGYVTVNARHKDGGAPVNFEGVVMARVRDGKIVEGWNCFDFLTMYQQIGWVKKTLP